MKYLLEEISASNACQAYELGVLFNDNLLINTSMEFIRKSTTEVVNSTSFLKASLETVETILEQKRLSATERTLLEGLDKYAKHNNCVEGIRGNALKNIQFLNMHPRDFAFCVQPSKLLLDDEKLKISFCTMLKDKSNAPHENFQLPVGFTNLSNRTSFSKSDDICEKFERVFNATEQASRALILTNLLVECDESVNEKREELLKLLQLKLETSISESYGQLKEQLTYSECHGELVDFLYYNKIDKILDEYVTDEG